MQVINRFKLKSVMTIDKYAALNGTQLYNFYNQGQIE